MAFATDIGSLYLAAPFIPAALAARGSMPVIELGAMTTPSFLGARCSIVSCDRLERDFEPAKFDVKILNPAIALTVAWNVGFLRGSVGVVDE